MATQPPIRRRSLRLPLVLVLASLVVFTAGVVVGTSPIRPLGWEPGPTPALEGPFTPNGALADMDRLSVGATGPEDVAVLPDGSIVTGVLDGRILRGTPDGGFDAWVTPGGRPLGMDVAPDGTLVVAVAERGLVSIAPDGVITDLLSEIGGVPLRFPDDVDVARDGTVYFTVASDRFGFADWELDVVESRGNGALYRLEPDGRVEALARNLYFGNGVAVADDESFALVVETSRYRVRRVWLSGPRAPGSEIVLAELPGFPDGIAAADDGTFWLAIAAPRNRLLDALAPWAVLRHFVAAMPEQLRPAPGRLAHVVNIDGDGTVIESLDDRSEGAFRTITNVVPMDGLLYLGSLSEPAIGRYRCGCASRSSTAEHDGSGAAGAADGSAGDGSADVPGNGDVAPR